MPTSIQHILKQEAAYKVNGKLWIEVDGKGFLGRGRIELLERIDESGSINQAAKQMGMSYKKAWEMITALNTQTERPLVHLQTGGERGGGSTITAEAKELIAFHRQFRERFTAFLERETKSLREEQAYDLR
jgi:molybdate transport system regulatory protein